MNCKLCGSSPQAFVAIPLRSKESNESLVCLECAQKSELFCLRHNLPHEGYCGGMSACQYCTVELAQATYPRARVLTGILEDAAPFDFDDFCKSRLKDAQCEEETEMGFIDYLAWEALCRKTSIDEVVRRIVVAESFAPIKIRSSARSA